MTQRKRLSNTQSKRRSDPLGEDDSDLAFTQPSTSQGQKGPERFSSSQMEQMTAEVIQYFLMKDQKKIPVRRADLVKHVLKDYRHIYPDIMKGVQQTFDQVFGLKLVEIDTKNHLYILINKLEPQEGVTPLQGPANPKTGLLFVILSVIFMKRGAVKESVIWSLLKKLHVDPGERHEQFGDVKKLVTDEFVRQRYLECVRIPHTEPVEFEFHWGQRAELEVSKAKILQFMGQLLEQDPPDVEPTVQRGPRPSPSSPAHRSRTPGPHNPTAARDEIPSHVTF